MKRSKYLSLMLCMVLLFIMPSSACAADRTKIYSEHFEITLPSNWYALTDYGYAISSNTEFIGLSEMAIASLTDQAMEIKRDEILDVFAKYIVSAFGSYETEQILVDNKITVLYTITKSTEDSALRAVQFVVPIWCDGALGYAYCKNIKADDPKSEFVSLIQSFKAKKQNAASEGYIQYGTAEIKPLTWKVKKSGNQYYILFDFSWRNLGDEPNRFVTSFSIEAYQNGIELKNGYLWDVDTETATSIMKGAELTCTEIFILRDTTSDVTLIINGILEKFYGVEDTVYTIKIKK